MMSELGDFDNNSIALAENDNYISRSKLQIIVFVLAVVLIPLFCLLGSMGNILSLVVLIHARMRNQTNYILAALCVSDTLFLIHCLIFTGLNIYRKVNPSEGEELRAHVYPFFGAYGSVVTARITSCLTTLLCAERYVAVFYPMQARFICSKKNTLTAIVMIYVLTLLLFIPFSLKYHAVDVNVNENVTRTYMNKTIFYTKNISFYSIYGTILNIIFRFAPLGIIPILNIRMVRAVHQTWKLRREMSGNEAHTNSKNSSKKGNRRSSTDQHRITIMLVTVASIFFICILPGAINSIATHIFPSYSRLGKAKNLYLCISSVTFLFETFNSSVNFIIYMAMNRKFRLLYKEIFCCGHGKYYNKISVSSVKDRFKWTSNKRSSDNAQNGNPPFRKTASDCGPLQNRAVSKRDLYNGVYSEGYNAAQEESSTDENLWIYKHRQSANNLEHSGENFCSNQCVLACNGRTRKRHSSANKWTGSASDKNLLMDNHTHCPKLHDITTDIFQMPNGTDLQTLTSNITIDTIYNINQELPLQSAQSNRRKDHGKNKTDFTCI